MLRWQILKFGAASLLLTLLGCGGADLSEAEDLPVREYQADVPLRMTVVMQSCGNPCATYENGRCMVKVEARTIELKPMLDVKVEREDAACLQSCGPPALVHCEVEPLTEGSYTVVVDENSWKVEVRSADGA